MEELYGKKGKRAIRNQKQQGRNTRLSVRLNERGAKLITLREWLAGL